MTLPNGKKGVYDFFIRDYQENVRMILTEETHSGINQCTMETSRSVNEERVFGQTGSANEVSSTRLAKPTGWTSNTSSSVSKLSKLSGHTIGPNTLLKVMAGDVLNAKTDYYYQSPVTNNSNSIVTDVINNLVMAISGSAATSSTVKSGTSGISTNLNGSVPFANAADPNRYTTDNIPRAYLNILFFDERFNFVAENSTAVRVSQSGDGAAPLVLPANTKAPKNGYAYIYVSNENDDAVYFDNFQVSDNRGRIIEENHYYAFGLKIAGISSVKLPDTNEGNINNKNLYNDKELIDEADLNWYDYGFRNYDAQIGRFPQLDPLTDDYPHYTPFQYAGNEPIANVDLDGLEESLVTGAFKGAKNATQLTATVVGHAAPKVAQAASTTTKILSIASMTANAAKLYTTLDGQKSLSSDIENRLQINQVKEINKHWIPQGSNKSINEITGQIRYSTTASQYVAIESIIVPIPKVGWAFKLLGRESVFAAKAGGRVFWAGGEEAMTAAASYAESTGGKTLEMTFGGRIMSTLNPVLPRWISNPVWKGLSKNFANGARGSVDVFHNVNGVRLSSVWRKSEFGILRQNQVDIFYHNVTP